MGNPEKIYFLSDMHLGMHPAEKSLEREKKLVSWLESIRHDAAEIYLLGDVFDYWFEYKRVVPRGFTRFLGKIADICDEGIKVNYFTGNHDVWVFDYLVSEIGVEIFRHPIVREYGGKKFFIAHGDGLGPGQTGYKILKWLFTNKTAQWLYARIHPNFATGFAHHWSKKSRYQKGVSTGFLGEDKEHLILFAKEKQKQEHFDYYIFGHRHLPYEFDLAGGSRVIYLGDWIENFSYAVIDGDSVQLKKLS